VTLRVGCLVVFECCRCAAGVVTADKAVEGGGLFQAAELAVEYTVVKEFVEVFEVFVGSINVPFLVVGCDLELEPHSAVTAYIVAATCFMR